MAQKIDIGIISEADDVITVKNALPGRLARIVKPDFIDSIRYDEEGPRICWIFIGDETSFRLADLKGLTKDAPVVAVVKSSFNQGLECSLLKRGVHEIFWDQEVDPEALERSVKRACCRFEALDEIRSRERMFKNLCDTLPFQMSYRIEVPPGQRARFVYVSEGVLHISGLSREEVLNDPDLLYEQIIPQDRQKLKLAEDEAVRTLSPFEIEVRKKDTNGNIRWVHIRSFPQRKKDGTIIWDGVESNIDSYKQAEEAVKELLHKNEFLLASERQAREESEHNSRMKDEFLATLSHELRTPINAVLGWAQLIKRRVLNKEETDKAIDIVERNARAQAQLIADLLDMSRIISGKITLDLERINVHQFIMSMVESFAPSAEAKEIRLEVIFGTAPDDCVMADATRLQQIMSNLLSNAVKFTPKDGYITIMTAVRGGDIDLSVKDSGIGIKPEFLPQVFERFRQADASFSRTFGGLGLGLAIVRHLTLLHGGHIKAESEGEGRGATFTVSMPKAVEKSSESRADFSLIGERPVESFSFSNSRILIVDDEPDSLELLHQILKRSGAAVSLAAGSEDALLKLQDRTSRFDLLISDIGMPGKDGLQLIRELRRSFSANRNIPAIALTAFARAEDKIAAIEAGYQYHLAKPVNPAELFAAISEIFSIKTGKAANL